jgi:hypothetical protein
MLAESPDDEAELASFQDSLAAAPSYAAGFFRITSGAWKLSICLLVCISEAARVCGGVIIALCVEARRIF